MLHILLPPRGFRPKGPTLGPKWMLTPLPRNSSPIATPRRRIRSLSHVAPTVIYVRNQPEFVVSCKEFEYPCWKRSVVVGVPAHEFQRKPTTLHHEINSPNTKRPILQAELRNSDSQCTPSVANASAHENTRARSDVCFLGEGHIGYKKRSLAVTFAPLRQPSSMRCWFGSALSY
jgi:hypothetical protein